MEGVHSIDVGILMLPIIVELLKHIAETNNVKYKTGIENGEPAINNELNTALALKELKETNMQEKPIIEEEEVEEKAPQPTGLMARSI
jgi:hypothetical protein